MKSTSLYRPARRLSPARHARLQAANIIAREAREAKQQAQHQARQDERQQQVQPTPEWEAAPRLTALPGGLYWSGKAPVPAIGETVTMQRAGQPEQVTVAAYCHAAGFLGLVVQPATRPKSRQRSSPRANCVFASQLQLMQVA